MVVSDISAACAELVERGVDVGDVQVFPWGSFSCSRVWTANGWAMQQLSAARARPKRSSEWLRTLETRRILSGAPAGIRPLDRRSPSLEHRECEISHRRKTIEDSTHPATSGPEPPYDIRALLVGKSDSLAGAPLRLGRHSGLQATRPSPAHDAKEKVGGSDPLHGAPWRLFPQIELDYDIHNRRMFDGHLVTPLREVLSGVELASLG